MDRDITTAEAVRRPSAETIWAVEARGVLLLNRSTGRQHRLAYPQAALWDLLTRGHDWDRVLTLTAAIAGLPLEETEALVLEFIEDLTREGFLTGGESHG